MLGSIFKSLDVNTSNGLANEQFKGDSIYQQQFFNMAREKLGIDAVYFLRDAEGMPKIPLIYFAAMDTYNQAHVAELHRLAWNLGEAPLLFIVTPDLLLIYNNYIAPKQMDGKLDVEAGLINTINLISSLETERQLLQYHRIKLETGEFWRENNYRFDVKNRVDTTLMNNLRVMRSVLISDIRSRVSEKKLSDKQLIAIVHALLGRSILTKYLEERKDKEENTVFPEGFFSKFKDNATKYVDLLDDKASTYKLFEELAQRFNGDMFPLVNKEYEIISQSDLVKLKDFMLGTTDLENSQMTLWPLYSFNIIPIQLISNIYELFFHLKINDKSKKDGTYYTPYHLVSMLMDEVLPWEGYYVEKRILDPSCGSGIFLVEAYRRLVGKWIYTHDAEAISNRQLVEIMQRCIYGVDLNEEAIRIASFSLSLVMCDYLEPRSIWETLTFPRLLGYNLFFNDFFCEGKFEERKYDIIIGNPPWESKLTEAADRYIKENNYKIGDNQIAQAFSWKAGELCNSNGIICLLMPSKALLFNRSEKNIKFRNEFFSKYNVSVVINYSIFRKTLFEHATGPATAIVYNCNKSEEDSSIFYCTPKPTFTIEDRWRFLIEPTDINKIPRDVVNNHLIWKVAMWGTPRDLELINGLETRFQTLEKFMSENQMVYAEGFIRGTKPKIECKDFYDWPLITTRKFNPFYDELEEQERVNFTKFYRCAQKNKVVFTAPHLIFKQSPKKGRFLSAVIEYNALFGNSFIGIHGNINLLKYISIMIYSKIFVYYSLMTSRRWLVERDELNVGELLSFPIPFPTENEITEACHLYDINCKSSKIAEETIDEFAYKIYKLKKYEIEFVEDAVSYIYDYFYVKGKSKSLASVNEEDLKHYQEVLINILKKSLGNSEKMVSNYYSNEVPLTIVQIIFGEDTAKNTDLSKAVDINNLLMNLDSLLLSERSGSVAIKRNVRVYNKNSLYIIKPNQSRYWSYTAACKDADEIYAEIMRTWREEYE